MSALQLDPTVSLALLLSIGSMIVTWIRTRGRALDTRFDRLDERLKTGSHRMDQHDVRIAGLEQTVAGLPSKEDIHMIEIHMERINGAMGRMEAVLEGSQRIMGRLETIVTRHEDHLLSGAKQ